MSSPTPTPTTPTAPTPVHVNSATLLMGVTGSGKSSLIATLAEKVMDEHRLQTVLVSTDGGGIPSKVQALVRAGAMLFWRARTRGEAFETTIRASQGYLPVKLDRMTGETQPFCKLVPPVQVVYLLHCPNGHEVKRGNTSSAITPQGVGVTCPTCRVAVTVQTMKLEKITTRTKGFERIGAMAFDGLTSMLAWQMSDLGDRHARNELKGEEAALGGRISSGELVIGGNNRAHYGFVQGRAEAMVHNSLGIPGLVVPPVWTALTLEAVDEGGLAVVGPQLSGKAKTDVAGAWFGNCLEVGIVKDGEGATVRRLYLTEYLDDQQRRHLIKHRGSPSMPDYLQDPAGQPWHAVSLGVFFSMLEADIAKDTATATAKYGEVGNGEYSFGEEEGAAAAPAPAAAKPSAPAPTAGAPRPVGRPPAAKKAPVTASQPATGASPAPPAPEPAPVELAEVSTPVEIDVPLPYTEPTVEPEPVVVAPTPAPPVTPAPVVAMAPRVGPTMGRPFAPPPGPRPPAPAPRVRPPSK